MEKKLRRMTAIPAALLRPAATNMFVFQIRIIYLNARQVFWAFNLRRKTPQLLRFKIHEFVKHFI